MFNMEQITVSGTGVNLSRPSPVWEEAERRPRAVWIHEYNAADIKASWTESAPELLQWIGNVDTGGHDIDRRHNSLTQRISLRC